MTTNCLSSIIFLIWIYVCSSALCNYSQQKHNTLNINYTKDYNPFEEITAFTPELSIYYSNFIGIGYCYQERIASGNCCNDQISSLGWNRFDSNYTYVKQHNTSFLKDDDDYNFQILYNNDYKKVMILFPGTRSINEFFDLLFNYDSVPFNNSETQKIFKFYYRIYEEIRPVLFIHLVNFYKKYPLTKNYQTILMGHSLGGVMSNIFAYDTIVSGILKKSTNSPVTISFGQPRIGNSYLVDEINKAIPLIFRVVRIGDEITQLPFFEIECKAGNPECQKKTIYRFIHTKGLKIINDDMTLITQCEFKGPEEYDSEYCDIKVNIFQVAQHHLYYFRKDKRIDQMCPEGLIKNKMKKLKQ